MRRREQLRGRRRSPAAGARAARACGRRGRPRASRSAADRGRGSWRPSPRERVSIHFTGRPREARGLRDRELLGVDVELRAEAAADVGRDHAHLRLGDAADRGHERAHEVRHLGRGVERQLVAGRDPVGDARRAARSATGVRRWLSIVSETLTGAASKTASKPSVLCSIVQAVVAGRLVVELRRARLAGVLGVDHDRQRVVVDDDAVGGVAGRSPATRPRPARPARRPCAPCRRPGSAASAARRRRTDSRRTGRRPRGRAWRR